MAAWVHKINMLTYLHAKPRSLILFHYDSWAEKRSSFEQKELLEIEEYITLGPSQVSVPVHIYSSINN